MNQTGKKRLSILSGVLLLIAAVGAWATIAHFNECGSLDKEGLLFSKCESLLPKAGFNKLDEAPEFRQTNQLQDLPISLTRVSDNKYFQSSDGQAVHAYSRRQVWNSDESLLDVGGKIVDTKSYEFVLNEIQVSSERVWSTTNPDAIYGFRFAGDVLNEFVRLNVRTDTVEVLLKLAEQNTCSIGRGEGSQSNDDNMFVFVCGDQDDKASLITFDLKTNSIVGELQLNEHVNWASFSQSGKYVVVESKISKEAPRRLTRFSPSLTEPMLLSLERHHGDLGLDDNGEDVFVMIGGRFITYVRLADAQKTRIPVAGFTRKAAHGHVSCRNILRPGWCYVSSYANVIGAVRIAKSSSPFGLGIPKLGMDRAKAIFELWGYHESDSENYPAQPKASASPSGKQVIFSSNWRGTDETNAYVLSRQVE